MTKVVRWEPTKALLLFEGSELRSSDFSQRLRRAIEELSPHHTQKKFVGRDCQLHLFVQPEAIRRIEARRVLGRMFGEIQLGRVLHDQHDRLLAQATLRGLPMRLQNLFGRDRGNVEKPVRRDRLAPPLAKGIDARLRIGRQRLQNLAAPLVQPFIGQFVVETFELCINDRSLVSPCK